MKPGNLLDEVGNSGLTLQQRPEHSLKILSFAEPLPQPHRDPKLLPIQANYDNGGSLRFFRYDLTAQSALTDERSPLTYKFRCDISHFRIITK